MPRWSNTKREMPSFFRFNRPFCVIPAAALTFFFLISAKASTGNHLNNPLILSICCALRGLSLIRACVPGRVHVRLSARTGDCRGSAGGQGAADIRIGRRKRKVGRGCTPEGGVRSEGTQSRTPREVRPFVQPGEGEGGARGRKKRAL